VLRQGNPPLHYRRASREEQSSTYLVEYHEELIDRLRIREAEAARAFADDSAAEELAKYAAAAAAEAAAAGDKERAAELAEAARTAETAVAHAERETYFRTANLAEWRDFIREPLRQTRMEMRRRGMLLPDLPADLHLGLDEDDR